MSDEVYKAKCFPSVITPFPRAPKCGSLEDPQVLPNTGEKTNPLDPIFQLKDIARSQRPYITGVRFLPLGGWAGKKTSPAWRNFAPSPKNGFNTITVECHQHRRHDQWSLIDMYIFEFWTIQLKNITGSREMQSPYRLHIYATWCGKPALYLVNIQLCSGS